MAQVELWKNNTEYDNDDYILPTIDAKVVFLPLAILGVLLEVFVTTKRLTLA